MKWTENEVLLHQRNYSSGEIWKATCNEIGKHYQQMGWHYLKSRPKLSIDKNGLRLEIGFSSSRSNLSNEWIALEMIPNIKSCEMDCWIIGHTGLLYSYYDQPNPKLIKVEKIIEDDIFRIDNDTTQPMIIKSANANIANLNEIGFKKIIQFIDNELYPWLDKLQTEIGIQEILKDKCIYRRSLRKDGMFKFESYVKSKFPHLSFNDE